MNRKFNIHFDKPGSTGGLMSSRHMNRSQARQVIRDNIINNYLLYRNDGGISPDILKDIVVIESRLSNKFRICQPTEADFKNFLCCSGSVYWCFSSELCMLTSMLPSSGLNIEPEMVYGVLMDSAIFYSKQQNATYRILEVRNEIKPSSTTLAENARLVDELDSNYGILDALVDGYMWGQSQVSRYEQIYFYDTLQAPVIWMDISQAHFAWERKRFETDIMPDGSVSLKARD